MTVLTKKKMIDALKGIDPDTDLTAAMLEQLENRGSIRSSRCGNRTYYDLEVLIEDLNKLFGLSDNVLPRVRTLHNAYEYVAKKGIGFSRRTVYGFGTAKDIPKLHIGTRTYIVLELFDSEGTYKLKDHMFKVPHTTVEGEKLSYTILPTSYRRKSSCRT